MRSVSTLESLFWDNLPWVVQTYTWVLFTFGIYLCWKAYRETKLKGYLLIMVFFIMPYFLLGFNKVDYQINKEEYQRIFAIKKQELHEKIERGEPIDIQHNVPFPFSETLLVLGLFFVTKHHIKGANQTE